MTICNSHITPWCLARVASLCQAPRHMVSNFPPGWMKTTSPISIAHVQHSDVHRTTVALRLECSHSHYPTPGVDFLKSSWWVKCGIHNNANRLAEMIQENDHQFKTCSSRSVILSCHSLMAPLFSKVYLNKFWHDAQNEVTLICAKFGKDLFSISKAIGRKTKRPRFFGLPCRCNC